VIGFWDRAIFNDECKVEVGANKRVYVWTIAREEWNPACLNTPPRRKFEIMVWGCISYNEVGSLALVEGNLNLNGYQDILESSLWPVVSKYFSSSNNAPVYRSRSTIKYKLRNKIKSLSWPAQSPDLNI